VAGTIINERGKKMKKKCIFIIVVMLFLGSVSTELFGQSASVRTLQLGDAISRGSVTLTARGNGGSSGGVVLGSLRNNTPNKIRIFVILNGGLYLSNSGSGQNMIATQIFLSDGGYYPGSGLSEKYIELSPNANTQIRFTAYCADFERENPSAQETFNNISMPSGLQSISSKISRYENDNFNDNLVVPIQLALWRSQGQSRAAIARKFNFTDADWEIATRILNY
jgi:hypothetical protein